MKRKSWKDARDKRDSGGFVAIPLAVLESRAFREASPYAKALLMDMATQLRGDNNGDLSCTWNLMKERGWRSQETLYNAKQELLQRGLIFETRKGGRPNRASLYAVTWLALDHCGGKLDITAASFPRGAYKLMDDPPRAPTKNATLTTATVARGG